MTRALLSRVVPCAFSAVVRLGVITQGLVSMTAVENWVKWMEGLCNNETLDM
jgi:hypothetical protein